MVFLMWVPKENSSKQRKIIAEYHVFLISLDVSNTQYPSKWTVSELSTCHDPRTPSKRPNGARTVLNHWDVQLTWVRSEGNWLGDLLILPRNMYGHSHPTRTYLPRLLCSFMTCICHLVINKHESPKQFSNEGIQTLELGRKISGISLKKVVLPGNSSKNIKIPQTTWFCCVPCIELKKKHQQPGSGSGGTFCPPRWTQKSCRHRPLLHWSMNAFWFWWIFNKHLPETMTADLYMIIIWLFIYLFI